MAKVWDDFLPLVKPHIPGCPDITVKTYLAITAADFFAQTHLWRDDIDPIFTAPGIVEYDLSADVFVEAVTSVVVDNMALQHTDIRMIGGTTEVTPLTTGFIPIIPFACSLFQTPVFTYALPVF